MNILIPNSWLKDFLETDATPEQFAQAMSLTSVSIEKMEKIGDDVVYDIEVTSNRPDLMSIEGIAREASAVLPQQGYKSAFKAHKNINRYQTVSKSPHLTIVSDKALVNRILAVVLEVELAPSPALVSKRLEKTGIRSINNVVDVTNYIMREVGHPSHVFDYDRLLNHTLIIRKSKKGERIVTLDEKEYALPGNDIVADDGARNIVDLLGVMGTANSAVIDSTQRVVLFLDNNNPYLLRQTSMGLGIRTEAAILNEKGLDPELMMPTLLRGIELLKENANAKIISPIIDIYPNKHIKTTVRVTKEKIQKVIGVDIPDETIKKILTHLGFEVLIEKNIFIIGVPSSRSNDVSIPEDIVEEIARVYGYNKIPNNLPVLSEQSYYHQETDEFYWVAKIKEAFRFWGYNEIYSYSMVSEELLDGPIENAVKLKNPLTEDHAYLRRTLIPSLLRISCENKHYDSQKLFEIANVYIKRKTGLPEEKLHIAGVIKGEGATFYEAKGVVEQLFRILGIQKYSFEKKNDGIDGAWIKMNDKLIGQLDVEDAIAFELDFTQLLLSASPEKNYIQPAKFPPIIEDVRIELASHYGFTKIEKAIKGVSELVHSLLEVYENKKTFRITYLNRKANLKNDEITPIRQKVEDILTSKFKAKIG